MLLAFLLACTTDVNIMKRQDTQPDSNSAITDTGLLTEPSVEPDAPRSGITGYNYLHLRQIACPACMGETQEITITFQGEFNQPSSDGYTEWIPAVGECTTSLFGVEPSVVPLSVGSSIVVNSPAHNFSVPAMGEGFYWTTNIWESQLQRDTLYTVQTELGSYSFLSSHGFDFLEPYTMLWVDPSYAFDTPVYRSGAAFTWGPTSLDSTFLITLAVYSADGSQLLGYVACAGEDNGSMIIPSQHLQIYPAGALVAIHLSRHRVELVETDINNSYIETHTEWEVVGTGHIE
jgi:hypothetical protein